MKQTPLTGWHRQHGAKMMEFGGYDMPVEYTGIIQEHEAVRTQVGMFDVSHMAEFLVEGAGAAEFLDKLVTNLPSHLTVGQALYTPMCYPHGGTVDDLLIYRKSPDHFMMVVNAGNYAKDWEWVTQHATSFANVRVVDISQQTALIAVQGPQALERLAPLTTIPLGDISYYHAVFDQKVAGLPAHISRTGYTGEDGLELYVDAEHALALWERLAELGIPPIGLGARDTLRLEARLPLYGHELTEDISPLEAGVGMFVKWEGHSDFIGKDALAAQKAKGLQRKVVGLELNGGIARSGYPVFTAEHELAGYVTSGSYSPTLKKPIALALLDSSYATIGQEFLVEVRHRKVQAKSVKTPFYRRPPR
ncbi:MAG: glycine cleavage system protein T [Sulfobacillus thermosulfidooxidans]|nr:MAG: glycine cleavage system protein T [Sulfobacillus thermosulfidooxidans]